MMVFADGSPASVASQMPQFWLTLALVGIPGILGGLTNSISFIVKPAGADSGSTSSSATSPPHSAWFYVANGVTGLGGSLAALLVILWAGRFPANLADLQALLTLTCTGYVAGYIAIKLLPAIADRFYKQFADLKEQQAQLMQRTDQLASKTHEGLKNAVTLATELTKTIDYLSSPKNFDPRETQKIMASLTSLVPVYPTNRLLNILLSRIWEEACNDRGKAVDVLKNFVKAKLGAGEKDDDLATAYWNLANYLEFDFKESNNPDLRTQAIEALQHSIEISPSNRAAMLKDPDFTDLLASDQGEKAFSPLATVK